MIVSDSRPSFKGEIFNPVLSYQTTPPRTYLFIAAFTGSIDSYFKWPSSWDVPGLSQAFSPNYADDAWASHRCV